MPKKCDICVDQESKYKCPQCKIPYCSVICFKKHQLQAHTQVVRAIAQPPIDERVQNMPPKTDDLSKSQCDALDQNEQIKSLLNDRQLRQHLLKLRKTQQSSPNNLEAEFEQLKRDNAGFSQFAALVEHIRLQHA
ncbi:hypothetical protein MP228_002596 [Amoeboaphelidium protococcarum]|nr:hypothetical protein MP228_002596 [Amoeboaphelidium protococcarum]